MQDYKGTSLLSIYVVYLGGTMVCVQLSCKSHALACLEVHVQTCFMYRLLSFIFLLPRISSMALKAGSAQGPISPGSYPISSLIGWHPSS